MLSDRSSIKCYMAYTQKQQHYTTIHCIDSVAIFRIEDKATTVSQFGCRVHWGVLHSYSNICSDHCDLTSIHTYLTQFRTRHPDFFSFVKDGVDGLVAIGTVGKTESKKATKFQKKKKKERRRRRSALKFQMIYSIAIPYFMRS